MRRYRGKVETALSQPQEEFLALGHSFFGGGPYFASETEERASWRLHRDRLIAKHDVAGSRPYGYWRHDLGIPQPASLLAEAGELDRLGLLPPAEATRCEQQHLMLDPGQAPETNSRLARFATDAGMRCKLAEDCRIAADWHARRGRTQLEEKYRTLQTEIGKENRT